MPKAPGMKPGNTPTSPLGPSVPSQGWVTARRQFPDRVSSALPDFTTLSNS
jgi:hypothetical protein